MINCVVWFEIELASSLASVVDLKDGFFGQVQLLWPLLLQSLHVTGPYLVLGGDSPSSLHLLLVGPFSFRL